MVKNIDGSLYKLGSHGFVYIFKKHLQQWVRWQNMTVKQFANSTDESPGKNDFLEDVK